MPWKIVNADFDSNTPHVYWRDPKNPIHLLTSLREGLVHIFVGDEVADKSPVHVVLSREGLKVVRATRWKRIHLDTLSSILGSLGCPKEEQNRALGWMFRTLRHPPDADGYWRGDEESTIALHAPAPTGWPQNLDDDDLEEALKDGRRLSNVRWQSLVDEARRRGWNIKFAS
jgi:hypothetical protein